VLELIAAPLATAAAVRCCDWTAEDTIDLLYDRLQAELRQLPGETLHPAAVETFRRLSTELPAQIAGELFSTSLQEA
jgi:hypothetical protein